MSITAALLLCACPRPERPPPELSGATAEQLLGSVVRTSQAHAQAIGATRISYLATDGVFRGDADVAIARESRIRIELRSFFGQPAYSIAADGENFVFVDNLATAVVQGPISSPRLSKILPLPLPAHQVVAILLGAAPPVAEGVTRYVKPSNGDSLALEHRSGDEVWYIGLGDGGAPLRALSHGRGGEANALKVRFSEHDKHGLIDFPMNGEAEIAGRAGAVRWRWTDVEVNGEELDPSAWSLLIPPGYSVENAEP